MVKANVLAHIVLNVQEVLKSSFTKNNIDSNFVYSKSPHKTENTSKKTRRDRLRGTGGHSLSSLPQQRRATKYERKKKSVKETELRRRTATTTTPRKRGYTTQTTKRNQVIMPIQVTNFIQKHCPRFCGNLLLRDFSVSHRGGSS